jgi:Fe2+ transport system protein FeoA
MADLVHNLLESPKCLDASQLTVGERAKIVHLDVSYQSLKLIQMGFRPGEIIQIDHFAPLSGPAYLCVGNSGFIALRKNELSLISVVRLED